MRCVLILMIAVAFSCNKKDKSTSVRYDFIPFYLGKVYLEKIPVNDEALEVIDSAEITATTSELQFTIPPAEESVFRLRVAGQPLRIYLINDVEEIIIKGSSKDPKDYYFRNGGINPVLKSFIDKQQLLVNEFTPLATKARETNSVPVQQKLMQQADSLKNIYERNARSFADTVSSPGAFLFAYNAIEFGEDRTGMKTFIDKAGDRFPTHKNVQLLVKETLDYLAIYEHELNLGEQMPALSLPDTNGVVRPVSLLTGRYTFIDLWSTWCGPCLQYFPVLKQVEKKFPGELTLITIAVDAEKDAWKQILRQQQLEGGHFIDEKMWRGNAAKAWKFDSIPFNFLVSPEGRIVAKAIKPDSLIHLLDKIIQ